MGLRNAVRVVTLAAAAGALAFAILAPPRVLWHNAGPRVDYPWPPATAALAGALILGGFAWSLGARRRALALIPAVLLALRSWQLFAYVLSATDTGILQRDLLGSSSVAWPEVTRVDLEPRHIVVHGRSDILRIPTHRISAENRARLERTISRQVREAGPRSPPPAR